MADTLLDYETEAAHYDETRGGVPRAGAAAAAVLTLVPPAARTLLDLACGTGLVTERLTRPGLRVLGADAAHAMARTAAGRLPGRTVRADARRLPLPGASLDAVTAVWLLHLVPFTGEVLAEAARVLRPGGVLVTTVDKDACHDVGSDIDALLRPHRTPATAHDRTGRVDALAAAHGLVPAGTAAFTGHGQGATPEAAARRLRAGHYASWFRGDAAAVETLARALAALPGQTAPRPAPTYRLRAYTRAD